MSRKTNFTVALIYVTILALLVSKISIGPGALGISFENPILAILLWVISVVSLILITKYTNDRDR